MILKVTDLTRTILTVAYLTKTILSYILDQDYPYSYMTKTILTVAYLTKTVSLTLDFTTSFQSPALLFLTHVTQLPCFQAKIHETGFARSCGMESKVTGSLFQA